MDRIKDDDDDDVEEQVKICWNEWIDNDHLNGQ